MEHRGYLVPMFHKHIRSYYKIIIILKEIIQTINKKKINKKYLININNKIKYYNSYSIAN